MIDLDNRILEVLENATRPVTLREVALEVGRISSVDKKDVDYSLRVTLRELVLKDACQRWRLAYRPDLTDTIPRVADKERKVSGLVFGNRGRFAELAKDDPTVKATLEWAAELDAEKSRLQADIDEHGGEADVWVLYDLAGKEINAKVVNGKNAAEWAILDADGRMTPTRLPYRPLQQDDLQAKGYREACKRRPATAMIIFASSGAQWPRVEAVIKPAVKVQATKEHLGERTIERLLRGLRGSL